MNRTMDLFESILLVKIEYCKVNQIILKIFGVRVVDDIPQRSTHALNVVLNSLIVFIYYTLLDILPKLPI